MADSRRKPKPKKRSDESDLTRHQRAVARTALREGLRYVLNNWDCLCQECMAVRAEMLTDITGLPIQPLQLTEPEPVVENCLREFGAEVDLDAFINGEVRPQKLLILYRTHSEHNRPRLLEMSLDLTQFWKVRDRVQ